MARTHSATLSFDESAHGSTGRPRASIFSSAMSVPSSVPMILARNSRLSGMTTETSARASPTTWLLVSMYPSLDTTTPDPRLCDTRFR